ncbi:MAG TPA: sigma-70 family RNA polymerase sigma factor [Planctomycetota bacterium]|nr:sigma-70 family RNA polymerase sigma factor [Planctomycetota bacterium]
MAITTECREIVAQWDYRKHIPEKYWEVVERCRPELVAHANSILNDLQEAEDVVQETFLEIFRDPKKISHESIGASLKLINRCNALDRLRNRKRAEKRSQKKQAEMPGRALTTGPFSRIESKEALLNALGRIPEHLRQVVELRYFQHYSYKDIAARLKIPIGGVGPLLSEASLLLYELLNDDAAAESDAPAKE